MEKNVSLRLKVILPGRVMFSEQECSKNSNYQTFQVKGKKPFYCKMRSSKQAFQSLLISPQAVEEFISITPPAWVKFPKWKTMSQEKRLAVHLDAICKQLGGISYTYQFIKD